MQAKKELVARVVSGLALESCRNTCIGSVLSRGISGGEVRNLPYFSKHAVNEEATHT